MAKGSVKLRKRNLITESENIDQAFLVETEGENTNPVDTKFLGCV